MSDQSSYSQKECDEIKKVAFAAVEEAIRNDGRASNFLRDHPGFASRVKITRPGKQYPILDPHNVNEVKTKLFGTLDYGMLYGTVDDLKDDLSKYRKELEQQKEAGNPKKIRETELVILGVCVALRTLGIETPETQINKATNDLSRL